MREYPEMNCRPIVRPRHPDDQLVSVRIAGRSYVPVRREVDAYKAAYEAQRKKPVRKRTPKNI